MKPFVGLDVSLAKTAICVISEHGKIETSLWRQRVKTSLAMPTSGLGLPV